MSKLTLAPSRKVVIEFEGKEYEASPIKLADQLELEQELEEAEKKGFGGAMMTLKLLKRCGLPEEMLKRLDAEQVEVVAQALKPGAAKKK